MPDPQLTGSSRRAFIRTTVGLGVAAGLAGCGDGSSDGGDDDTPTPTPDPSLEIGRIQFAASKPRDYRDYEPVADKTYQLGDAVWLYFEPDNVARESAGEGTEQVDLVIEGTFRTPSGDVHEEGSRPVGPEFEAGTSLDTLYLWTGTQLPEDGATGTWTAEVTLRDRVADDSASFSREFQVEAASTQTYLEAFGSALQSETQVQLQGLERVEGGVELVYTSRYESETSNWREEIGSVAGIYARLVAQGWEAQRLAVGTTGSEGRTFTWHVDREDGLALVNDEISANEFGARIIETLKEQ